MPQRKEITETDVCNISELLNNNRMSHTEIRTQLGIPHATYYRYLQKIRAGVGYKIINLNNNRRSRALKLIFPDNNDFSFIHTIDKPDSSKLSWDQLRLMANARDGYQCQCNCHSNIDIEKLQTHHIKPKSQGGTDTLDNLITLCATCHSNIELIEQAKERQRNNA